MKQRAGDVRINALQTYQRFMCASSKQSSHSKSVKLIWTLSRLTDALPASFEAVLEAAHKAAEHQSSGDLEHWQMHQAIIQQDFAPLLARFVEPEDHQVGVEQLLTSLICQHSLHDAGCCLLPQQGHTHHYYQ